jgi:catechol 2,3-dioxygenase-like lactoylglutathione lyase family enzyme
MLNAITHHQVWVFDQDEALDFYVGRLAFEVHTDAQMEVMRWLTVNLPGQADREVMLLVPGPPAVDPDAVEEVRALVAKGHGGTMILTTDDCRADYARLAAAGVGFTEEPTERFYGTDCAMRDPFGNPIRMTQPAPLPVSGPPQSA